MLPGAGQSHISEATFFFETSGATSSSALVGKHAVLPTGQEHNVELKAFRGVERHQRDLIHTSGFRVLHHQADVLQEGGGSRTPPSRRQVP